MSGGKHTPGPWVATRNSHFWEFGQQGAMHSLGDVSMSGIHEKNGGYGVCTGDGPEFSGTAEANAYLIAAAPCLYSALKKIVFDWDGEPEDMADAIAAIRKAEGR